MKRRCMNMCIVNVTRHVSIMTSGKKRHANAIRMIQLGDAWRPGARRITMMPTVDLFISSLLCEQWACIKFA